MDEQLSVVEVGKHASTTVREVIGAMPEDLTPDQEVNFLVNTAKVLEFASMIITKMVEDKKTVTRH